MEKKPQSVLDYLLGVFFIILGIAGLVFPILPGWIFIFIGMAFLGNKKLEKFFQKMKNSEKTKKANKK